MKKIFVILALLISCVFAEGSIAARNASGALTASFYTTDAVYGGSFELICRNTSHPGTWVIMRGARVSLYLVPYWPFWPDDFSDPPFSLSNYLVKFSTNANSSGYVPNHIMTSGLPAGEYKLVLTFSDSDDNFRMNRQVSSSINCTDIVFPVVGGSPSMITSSAPPSCTGSIGLSGMPASATLGQSVPVTVSEISNCAGKTIYVRNGSCNGATLSSFISGSTGGSTTFAAPGPIGSRLIYVCSDLDGNGDFGGGEATFWSLNVQSGCSGTMSMTLSPDSIIPASIVTVNLAGFSGCNTPIYIKNSSCSGSTLQTFTEMPNGGTNSFIPLLGNGTYNIYACADFNSNAQFDAGEYASDALTIGTGGQQQGCTGTVDLDLSASNAAINQKIYYNISGYSNCGGRTVYLRKDSCSGSLVASYSAITEIYEITTSYQNYFNATSPGQFIYYACLDVNNDGDYTDAGEADSKSLTVDGGGGQTCDSTHCSSCANSTSCSAANCQWTGSSCIAKISPQCSPCSSCQNLTSCISSSCYWCDGVCQTGQCLGSPNCSSNDFAACFIESACVNVGGHWCNGLCQAADCSVPQTCSHDNCAACKKPGVCSDENCFWHESSCHAQPPQNTGENFTIFINNSQIDSGGQVSGTVFGTSAEENKTIQIMKGSCNGTAITNCTIANGSCSFDFAGQEAAGNYTYVACLDTNGDGMYDKTTEAAPAPLIVKEPPTTQDVIILLGAFGVTTIVGFLGAYLYSYKKKQALLRQMSQQPMQQEVPSQAQPVKKGEAKPRGAKKKKK